MTPIEKSIIIAQLPKLKVVIGEFRNRQTNEIQFCVTQVNNTHQVFNGSVFELVKEHHVENTEMIIDIFTTNIADNIMVLDK